MKLFAGATLGVVIAVVLFFTIDLDPEPADAAFPTAVNSQVTD